MSTALAVLASRLLPDGERKVLHALRVLADDESKVTVAQDDIGAALGWTRRRSVRQCVAGLERRGLVHVQRNAEDRERRPNTFTVLPMGHAVAEIGRNDTDRSAA